MGSNMVVTVYFQQSLFERSLSVSLLAQASLLQQSLFERSLSVSLLAQASLLSSARRRKLLNSVSLLLNIACSWLTSRVLCKEIDLWVIISLMSLVCHQTQGQKEIFT